MKLNKKLVQGLLYTSILAGLTSSTFAATPSEATSCSKIKYVPRTPVSVAGSTEITSVSKFSPAQLKRGWMTLDHIGYKDTAYQGARHVALVDDGVQYFGYDIEPLTDMMLMHHPDGESQIINTIQAPVRADWHTLNGNGILFGCSFTGYEPDKDLNTHKNTSPTVSVTGYSVVATLDKIQVRQYSGATIDTIGENFQVLYEEPKRCPGQNFTVEITGSTAKVFLGSKKIYEFTLASNARGTGLITTYEEHSCSSLSSVVMMNHTVNGVDYLKPNVEGVKK